MQKIIPHLWFDKEAKQAAEFYVSHFPDSRITHSSTIHDTPSGDCDIMSFDLAGYSFMAISAGPYFKINPSVSFMVNFDQAESGAVENLKKLWKALAEGGTVRMPLQKYPFSDLYGWIEDRFGVSWQLMLYKPEGGARPFIMPTLMFTRGVAGKAGEATDFYMSVLGGERGAIARYGAGAEYDKPGTLMYTDFKLADQWFAAMDSAQKHDFSFNEAVSLVVECESQAEIDEYWKKLSAVPESEQCGWLKDRYGLSWQIVPTRMKEMMSEGTPDQIARVTKAFLGMKKFDIEALERAYKGA